jgi:hypothetical protein
MAESGLDAVIKSVRAFLVADAALASVGVAYGRAVREEALPYVVLSVAPVAASKVLTAADAMRTYRVMVKVCAANKGGQGANEIAKPLVDAAYTRFTRIVSGKTPQARLQEILQPLGFAAMVPLEVGDITPYSDTVGANRDIERWHFGALYDVRIAPLS